MSYACKAAIMPDLKLELQKDTGLQSTWDCAQLRKRLSLAIQALLSSLQLLLIHWLDYQTALSAVIPPCLRYTLGTSSFPICMTGTRRCPSHVLTAAHFQQQRIAIKMVATNFNNQDEVPRQQ